MMFVVPGEHPNLTKTSETLATITGGRVTVLDTRPFVSNNKSGNAVPTEGKRFYSSDFALLRALRQIFVERQLKYLIGR